MYQIGETYEVACAELRWREDSRIYYIPVFDHFHADPQFGFDEAHYHIDGRFEFHPRMGHYFKVMDGRTSAVIARPGSAYEFLGIVNRPVLCVRAETGLRIPEEGEGTKLYVTWYSGFIGRKCKGQKCPHFGTEMLERDGRLICPMHGLIADGKTLRVVDAASGRSDVSHA